VPCLKPHSDKRGAPQGAREKSYPLRHFAIELGTISGALAFVHFKILGPLERKSISVFAVLEY
jgi:hypothetical protein